MVGGICSTRKILIGPSIQIKVLSTDDAISSITNTALTLVHRIAKVTKEDAFSILVATVAVVLTGVVGFTHLFMRGQNILKLCLYLNTYEAEP